jgi:hypothetical protein
MNFDALKSRGFELRLSELLLGGNSSRARYRSSLAAGGELMILINYRWKCPAEKFRTIGALEAEI